MNVTLCDVKWCYVLWHDVTSSDVTCCDMTWCDLMWSDVKWCVGTNLEVKSVELTGVLNDLECIRDKNFSKNIIIRLFNFSRKALGYWTPLNFIWLPTVNLCAVIKRFYDPYHLEVERDTGSSPFHRSLERKLPFRHLKLIGTSKLKKTSLKRAKLCFGLRIEILCLFWDGVGQVSVSVSSCD